MVSAMVFLDCQAEDMEELLGIVEKTAELFAKQPGFISADTYTKTDRTQIIRQMRWENLEAHEACMRNPEILMQGQSMLNWIVSGRVNMDVQVYDVIE